MLFVRNTLQTIEKESGDQFNRLQTTFAPQTFKRFPCILQLQALDLRIQSWIIRIKDVTSGFSQVFKDVCGINRPDNRIETLQTLLLLTNCPIFICTEQKETEREQKSGQGSNQSDDQKLHGFRHKTLFTKRSSSSQT